MEDEGDLLIVIQIGETDFPYPNHGGKEGTQLLMSIGWKLRFLHLVKSLILNPSSI